MCYNPLLSLFDAWIAWSLLILVTIGWYYQRCPYFHFGSYSYICRTLLPDSQAQPLSLDTLLFGQLPIGSMSLLGRQETTHSFTKPWFSNLPSKPHGNGHSGWKEAWFPQHSLPLFEAAQSEAGGLLPNLWNGSIYWDIIDIKRPGTLGTGRFVNQWIWLPELGHSWVHHSTNICWASTMCQALG